MSLSGPDWAVSIEGSWINKFTISLSRKMRLLPIFTGFGSCQLCSPFPSYLCCSNDVIYPPLCMPFLYNSEEPLLCSVSSYQRNSKWATNSSSHMCNSHHSAISHQAATTNRSDETLKLYSYLPSKTQAKHSF